MRRLQSLTQGCQGCCENAVSFSRRRLKAELRARSRRLKVELRARVENCRVNEWPRITNGYIGF